MKWMLPCLGAVLTFASAAEAFYPLAPNQPRVCRARANKDMLELRYFRGTTLLVMNATATEKNEKGELVPFTIQMTKQTFLEQQVAIELAHVEAYADGKKIDGKDLSAHLLKEMAVLACSQMPDPDVLKIVKKGTLLLILPVSLDDCGPGGPGGGYTIPVPLPTPGLRPGPPTGPPPGTGTIPPKGT